MLTCRRGGKASAEFLKITLEDVVVSSYELDGSDEEPPLDQVAFAYAKIETEYTPVDKTGKARPVVKIGWDIRRNSKV